jgi:DNA repair exonuclease SbcCD ATPase subunit
MAMSETIGSIFKKFDEELRARMAQFEERLAEYAQDVEDAEKAVRAERAYTALQLKYQEFSQCMKSVAFDLLEKLMAEVEALNARLREAVEEAYSMGVQDGYAEALEMLKPVRDEQLERIQMRVRDEANKKLSVFDWLVNYYSADWDEQERMLDELRDDPQLYKEVLPHISYSPDDLGF